MLLTEVRSRFHALIDEVENPDLLRLFLNLFRARLKDPESKLWNALSEIQQNEVVDAFEESEKDSNLESNASVKKKYSQWLKK
jgi:hypothetical protein